MEAASYEEMFKKANLVVIARPLSTKETKERTTLDKLTLHGLRSLDGPAIPVIGLHTEFETHLVLKGDKNVKKFIVHHYRLESNLPPLVNGPTLAAFDLKKPKMFLLFLVMEPDGGYAPASGQVDPAAFSVIQLQSIAE